MNHQHVESIAQKIAALTAQNTLELIERLRHSLRTETSDAPERPEKPLTKDEFHRHLIAMGRMTQVPDTEADYDDPDDQPVEIEGEPLSETVIRDRR